MKGIPPTRRENCVNASYRHCPEPDDISGRLLRLPFHNNLPIDDADRVVEAFSRALTSARPKARH